MRRQRAAVNAAPYFHAAQLSREGLLEVGEEGDPERAAAKRAPGSQPGDAVARWPADAPAAARAQPRNRWSPMATRGP